MNPLAEEAARRLEGHARRQEKQKRRFCKRGHALDLAVAILVLGIGRFAGNADGDIGQYGCGEVEQRMGCFRQDRQRAGEQTDNRLRRGEPCGRGDRSERGLFLVVHLIDRGNNRGAPLYPGCPIEIQPASMNRTGAVPAIIRLSVMPDRVATGLPGLGGNPGS